MKALLLALLISGSAGVGLYSLPGVRTFEWDIQNGTYEPTHDGCWIEEDECWDLIFKTGRHNPHGDTSASDYYDGDPFRPSEFWKLVHPEDCVEVSEEDIRCSQDEKLRLLWEILKELKGLREAR